MCKRAWYGEEMYGEERRRLILDDMWRSREELNIFCSGVFFFLFMFVCSMLHKYCAPHVVHCTCTL